MKQMTAQLLRTAWEEKKTVALGICTAIAFVLCALKFVTKRLAWPRLDRGALQVHKIAALALMVLAPIHAIVTLRLWRQRPVGMIVLGAMMVAAVVVLVWSHVAAKRLGQRWLTIHRGATVSLLACLLAHIALGLLSGNG